MTQVKDHVIQGGPHIMGIVNVTPDSFSDGGKFMDPDKAIEHGIRLASEGALILDIGAESTRPGATPVDPQEEIRRIVPVIEGLKGKAKWISVDTRNSVTMEAALKAGANMINDVSALTHDARSVSVAAEAGAPIVFAHMKGDPESMQKNPSYNNVVEEVFQYLQSCITIFDTNRIDIKTLICDPGIGFGKSVEDNLIIIRNISRFHDLGVPVMLGASRKSFIGKISEGEPPGDRLSGSLAAALWGLTQGVQFYRVHDVKETRQAFKTYSAFAEASADEQAISSSV